MTESNKFDQREQPDYSSLFQSAVALQIGSRDQQVRASYTMFLLRNGWQLIDIGGRLGPGGIQHRSFKKEGIELKIEPGWLQSVDHAFLKILHAESKVTARMKHMEKKQQERDLRQNKRSESKDAFKIGDYVFVSRWSDGDPNDPWHVGFLERVTKHSVEDVYQVKESLRVYPNCRHLTKAQGERIVREYPDLEGSVEGMTIDAFLAKEQPW